MMRGRTGMAAWSLALGAWALLVSASTVRAVDPKVLAPDKPTATKPASKESPASKPSEKDKKKSSNEPQVEIFIPSFAALVEQAKASNTGRLMAAFSGMVPSMERENTDDFDFTAIFDVFKHFAEWPDSSLVAAIYKQDRDGRPRWLLRFDWPVQELRGRIKELLELKSAKSLVKDVRLRKLGQDSYKLELPDMVLAVLRPDGDGCLIASDEKIEPPATVFGQKKGGKKTRYASLVYCRFNAEAGDEDEKSSSMFGFVPLSDIRYAGSVDGEGRWKERFNIRLSPLISFASKQALKKATTRFDCPKDYYAATIFHFALAEGMADAIAGLPKPAIRGRAGDEAAVVAAPGDGFFPIPDLYYQFKAHHVGRIKKEIRKVLRDDERRRAEDDQEPIWHEEEVDGKTIFWCDRSADRAGFFSVATLRTAIFFEAPSDDDDDDTPTRLIIAQTSTRPADAVRRWAKSRRSRSKQIALPTDKQAHWQILVNWAKVYQLARPYLTVFATNPDAPEPVPSADEVVRLLCDSVVNVRIEYSGIDIRHVGPIPVGAGFVPGVAVAALWSTAAPSSEAQREQLACRNLRVLYHHAKLFRKDYDRWPANVAELDGYVDFASHPNLLYIPPVSGGFMKGFVSIFTKSKDRRAADDEDADEIDDTLYEIDWSPADWRLKYRDGEFINYATIAIDAQGEIHRIPRKDAEKKDKKEDKTAMSRGL